MTWVNAHEVAIVIPASAMCAYRMLPFNSLTTPNSRMTPIGRYQMSMR